MGTNYYARTNICSCCSRYDEFHICKSMVTFRGYRADPDWPDDPAPTPWGAITTWQDWRKALLSDGVEIWNEYGEKLDPVAFVATAEAVPPHARRRQYDWMVDQYPPEQRKDDWLDPDGFSFYGGEFS